MSAESDDERRARIEAEAADQIVRRDRGLSPEEVRALAQRLESDPEFRACVERFDQVWKRMDLASVLQPSELDAADPDLLAPRERRSRWVRPALAAAAAAAAIVVGAGLWAGKRTGPAAPRSGDLALEDGSKVELNGDAEISVEFGAAERRVRLVRGEAQFFVAKDALRPFLVEAGRTEVKAVGTAFDVALVSTEVDVIVTEGRIRLIPDTAGASAAPDRPAAQPLIEAGHRAVISSQGQSATPQITEVSPQQIDQLLAWQPRLMDYTDAPLARIVADFNRRNVTQLTIADPRLTDFRMSASLRSDNVDGFVRLLVTNFGISAVRRGPRELALTRNP